MRGILQESSSSSSSLASSSSSSSSISSSPTTFSSTGFTVTTSKSVPHSGQETTAPSSTSSSSMSRSVSHSGQYTMISSTFRIPLLYLVSSRGKGQVAYQENSTLTDCGSSEGFFTNLAAAWVIGMALACCVTQCRAQEAVQEPPRLAADRHSDTHIAEAIRQVSAEHIQGTIEKLVRFQNRSTISAQDEESIRAGKGIGAAREWIKAEFERYSKECGGCLEVTTDTFTEQPAERIPKPTEITNVYAVLHGSD